MDKLYTGLCAECGAQKDTISNRGKARGRCAECRSDAKRQNHIIQSRKSSDKIRTEVLIAYGCRCAYCGEANTDQLQIDHVFGDGKDHRVEFGGANRMLYYWLKKHGFPKDRFQLLCRVCNWAKSNTPESEFKQWVIKLYHNWASVS